MIKSIKSGNSSTPKGDMVLLAREGDKFRKAGISKEEESFINREIKKGNSIITINRYDHYIFLFVKNKKAKGHNVLESCRKAGHDILQLLNQFRIKKVSITATHESKEDLLALAEGIALSNYQFLKYLKEKKTKTNSLTEISIFSKKVSSSDVAELKGLVEAVYAARDLVNEPVSFLNAVQYSKEIERLGKESGFKLEVLNKKKLESLKMGGVLAVNKGSIDPPTFNILEWKPKNAKNKKPYVLVGKGIVYDTGGLSLKPTANSMDIMKCDMAGSASVVGALYALAKNKAPVHVVGLIPATDNRPSGNAYAPGDVITMFDGTTVEVLNTDAEGRLVLADALTYAKKYNPELVIDLATLTGAALRSIGSYGSVMVGTADEGNKSKLLESGNSVYERLVEFPLWDEYGEEMKSDIADLNNLGSPNAGAITAGKFLEHFTLDGNGKASYPWIHIDIAGPAYLAKRDSYRSKGGTGVGVRLLYDFLKNK